MPRSILYFPRVTGSLSSWQTLRVKGFLLEDIISGGHKARHLPWDPAQRRKFLSAKVDVEVEEKEQGDPEAGNTRLRGPCTRINDVPTMYDREGQGG
jgi:hypothetical protein